MSALDALLVIAPTAVCPTDEAKGRSVAKRATSLIETRLRRQLVVRPVVQRLDSRMSPSWLSGTWIGWYTCPTNWARQWPVVQLVSDRPFSVAEPLDTIPTQVEGAGYATGARLTVNGADIDLGDETGERLGLPEAPDDGLAVYLAGFRREDQLSDAGRTALNAAIAAAHPAWGTEALSAAAFARVPVLPAEIATAADELARGLLSTHQTGLGALASRTEERGESRARVQLAKGWENDILETIDHLAWMDL